ncbi:hypothetical protein PLESTB_001573900 [Pleodorina starrii]|uniref:COX assembly mitochondrial protein n=1 Tax=Pleodorina starrii TaxID=330485 RepID=A0A9W6BXI9_9CHLO|nr:hypothetical protein PLESTB_001573900 [Pleodorina starrii]GLC69000.1 hypothetical protein PLESTF_000768100 [Pleodorina starrii]
MSSSEVPDPSTTAEFEEKVKKDRERLNRDFDPYLQDGFSIYKTNPRRQEAYDRCAPQVVQFLKCVEQEGPTWFWRCNALHIELQRCYNDAKPETPSLLSHHVEDFKNTAAARWEQLKWWYESITGSKGDS